MAVLELPLLASGLLQLKLDRQTLTLAVVAVMVFLHSQEQVRVELVAEVAPTKRLAVEEQRAKKTPVAVVEVEVLVIPLAEMVVLELLSFATQLGLVGNKVKSNYGR
jgi:hypothetical protein